MNRYECMNFRDLNRSPISFPSCKDLGIPKDCEVYQFKRGIQNTSPPIDGDRYETVTKSQRQKVDPFSTLCMIPLPPLYEDGHMEPAFIRKRNERERERVRCVNEGYARLKQHLPIEKKEKRISKVETLRYAIEYIRYLQVLLADSKNDNLAKIYSKDNEANKEICQSSEDETGQVQHNITRSRHDIELSKEDVA
ncbi:hypothetical protein CHS0354_012982 [Potamilus streckersoni]|uniref:BHLH domain-containing protein n=1 Tax=Potamilus streckersoni TaxID=2493646 RepID=A0AAE0W9A2_9BIVA|nr:hypothetical protein CHS0354_012982 [Potamilus streckersoni]